MIESAGQQDLFHQLIDFTEIAADLGIEFAGRLLQPELGGDTQAGERGSQFMACVGEQGSLRR